MNYVKKIHKIFDNNEIIHVKNTKIPALAKT